MKKNLISINEAVKLSGISRSSIYRWAKIGRLNIYKVGWFSRIEKKQLLHLLNPTINSQDELTKGQIFNMINKQLNDLKEKQARGDIDHNTYVQIVKEIELPEERIKK